MMRPVILFAFIGLFAELTVAQSWRTVTSSELIIMLDASAAKINAMEAYEVTTSISAFRGPTGVEPIEVAVSKVWTVGSMSKAEHFDLISYQNEKVRVTVDASERVIVIGDNQEFYDVLGEDYSTFALDAGSIGRMDGPFGVKFRARYGAGSDFELIEFQFDRSGWLKRLEAQYGEVVVVDPSNPLSDQFAPRVVLEMGVPRRIAPGSVKVDPEEVVSFVGGKTMGIGAFKDFEVVDNRLLDQ